MKANGVGPGAARLEADPIAEEERVSASMVCLIRRIELDAAPAECSQLFNAWLIGHRDYG